MSIKEILLVTLPSSYSSKMLMSDPLFITNLKTVSKHINVVPFIVRDQYRKNILINSGHSIVPFIAVETEENVQYITGLQNIRGFIKNLSNILKKTRNNKDSDKNFISDNIKQISNNIFYADNEIDNPNEFDIVISTDKPTGFSGQFISIPHIKTENEVLHNITTSWLKNIPRTMGKLLVISDENVANSIVSFQKTINDQPSCSTKQNIILMEQSEPASLDPALQLTTSLDPTKLSTAKLDPAKLDTPRRGVILSELKTITEPVKKQVQFIDQVIDRNKSDVVKLSDLKPSTSKESTSRITPIEEQNIYEVNQSERKSFVFPSLNVDRYSEIMNNKPPQWGN